jgi:hypothetical protein
MVLPGSRVSSHTGLEKEKGREGCGMDRDDKYEIKSGQLLLMHR